MIDFFPSRAIAIEIGSFAIHWYGLLYLLAFLLGYGMVLRLQRYRNIKLSTEEWSSLLSWIILSVIVGGRLGYVLFYEPVYFFSHPIEVFAVWKGGMSSHGGFICVAIALIWVSLRRKIPLLALADILVVPAAIGLALGRVGNFINLELYGEPTSMIWGIAIPGLEELRHPTQIYAVAKNLFIALMCYLLLRKTVGTRRSGSVLAVFLLLYSVLRFLLEYIRVPTHPNIVLVGIELTRGQWLTMPLFAIGVMLLIWTLLRR